MTVGFAIRWLGGILVKAEKLGGAKTILRKKSDLTKKSPHYAYLGIVSSCEALECRLVDGWQLCVNRMEPHTLSSPEMHRIASSCRRVTQG